MASFSLLSATLTARRTVPFAAAAAIVGTAIVILSSAATPTASFEPEQGILAGGVVAAATSGASNGQAVKFATATTPAQCASGGTYLWSHLEACGWPGPTNTGPDLSQCPGGVLTINSGAITRTITISTDGTIISCQNITGGLQIAAQNVTIKNSIITYNGGGAGGSGVININDGGSATVDHVKINGSNRTHSCIFNVGVKGPVLAYSMVAKNVDCSGVNDGIFSWWWPSNINAGAGSDFIITDSYLHDFTENAANGHIDGYQTEGAQNGAITHNTFEVERVAGDVTVSGGGVNSAVAIWNDYNQSTPTGKVAGNITVDNNLITSGGFSIYAEDYSPSEGANGANGGNSLVDVHFINNKFSTVNHPCVGDYGVWFYRAAWPPYYGGPTDRWNSGGSSRNGNIVLETGFNLDNGNPAGCS
jgi:hypothetical protein